MNNIFLKAKHWQYFLIIFAVPMVLQMVFINRMFSSLLESGQPDIEQMFATIIPMFTVLFGFSFLLMFITYGWQWAVVVGLQEKLPEELRMSLTKFKIFFIIPAIYLPVFMGGMLYFMSILFSGLLAGGTPDFDFGFLSTAMLVIFPLHFFTMFCIFHSMYYAAKSIKTIELKKKTSFSDFAGEFFLIWFFPIGIWILQPRINKIVSDEQDVLVDQLVE